MRTGGCRVVECRSSREGDIRHGHGHGHGSAHAHAALPLPLGSLAERREEHGTKRCGFIVPRAPRGGRAPFPPLGRAAMSAPSPSRHTERQSSSAALSLFTLLHLCLLSSFPSSIHPPICLLLLPYLSNLYFFLSFFLSLARSLVHSLPFSACAHTQTHEAMTATATASAEEKNVNEKGENLPIV